MMTRTTSRRYFCRNTILAGVGALALSTLTTSAAFANDEAESIMTTVLTRANSVMAQSSLDARLKGIDELVSEFGDLRRTGRFTLGQYARRISPEQAQEFYPLFHKYATAIYQDILSDFSGEVLAVTGSIERSTRDIIVNSKIANAKPGDPFANTNVQWRLYRTPQGLKIVDAGADNIWLAIEQRSQFTAIIANNGGGTKGIDALINQLKERVGE